jgi:hypothetical protein
MTAPTCTDTTRTDAAAMLRTVADLIESRPDISGPYARVHYVLIGPDAADAIASITAVLPRPSQAGIYRNPTSGDDWLRLEITAGDAEVTVSAPAEAVCTATGTGTRTVAATTWEPQPALAAIVGDSLTWER